MFMLRLPIEPYHCHSLSACFISPMRSRTKDSNWELSVTIAYPSMGLFLVMQGSVETSTPTGPPSQSRHAYSASCFTGFLSALSSGRLDLTSEMR